MRTLLLLLLLANLIVFAGQFTVVRRALLGDSGARPPQVNAERLRIIRDTSVRPAVSPAALP